MGGDGAGGAFLAALHRRGLAEIDGGFHRSMAGADYDADWPGLIRAADHVARGNEDEHSQGHEGQDGDRRPRDWA